MISAVKTMAGGSALLTIPVTLSVYNILVTGPKAACNFVPSSSPLAEKVSTAFVFAGELNEHATEYDCHTNIDIILRLAFQIIPSNLSQSDRTVTMSLFRDSTGVIIKKHVSPIVEKARPDYFGVINETVCYFAEGKKDGTMDPKDDIEAKLLRWSIARRGYLPLLFGHVSRGLLLQFIAIDAQNKIHYVGESCDLRNAFGVSNALQTGLLIWRVLSTWYSRGLLSLPTIDKGIYLNEFKSNKFFVKICDDDDSVVFTWQPDETPSYHLLQLADIYTRTEVLECQTLSKILCLEFIEDKNQYHMKTKPLCSTDRPSTNDELVRCLQHIAKALHVLHKNG